MKVNIILEAKLSEVVPTLRYTNNPPPVPNCVWVIVGEFEISPDEDDGIFETMPIQEINPDTGRYWANEKYLIGSLSHEDLVNAIQSDRAVKISPDVNPEMGLEIFKNMKDLFETLGHDVLMFSTCDY